MLDAIIEKEKVLNNGLEAKYAAQYRLFVQQSADRELKFLDDLKEKFEAQYQRLLQDRSTRSQGLLIAWIKARAERDRLYILAAAAAAGVLALLVAQGAAWGWLPRALLCGALAGFIGAVLCGLSSARLGADHLERAMGGGDHHSGAMDKIDGELGRFFTFGVVCAVFLGGVLMIKPAGKVVVKPQAAAVVPAVAAVATEVPVVSQDRRVAAEVPPPAAQALSAPATIDVPPGNGGNFSSGRSVKK